MGWNMAAGWFMGGISLFFILFVVGTAADDLWTAAVGIEKNQGRKKTPDLILPRVTAHGSD